MPVSVTLSDSVVDDLALEDLGRFFLPPEVRSGEKGRKELKTWLETWLTADPAEIECRCRVILALSGMPDAREVLVRQAASARDAVRLRRARGRSLPGCAAAVKLLRLFVTETDALAALRGQDASLDELLSPILTLAASPAFAAAKAQLARAEAVWTPLETLTMGVNFTPYGRAVRVTAHGTDSLSAGVVMQGGAQRVFLLDANRDNEPDRGVLEPGYGSPNALFPALPVRERGEIAHLEAAVLSAAEHAWSGMLSRTHAALEPFPEEPLAAWLDWCAALPPILAGLTFTAELQRRGCALCQPVCRTGGLHAEALLSPDLTLRAHDLPVSCTADISRDSLVFITGVNHSGKTTFLKALAHAQLLAQLGFPLPAAAFSFVPFRHFFTLFGRGETEDLSRFEREAAVLREMLDHADGESALYLNEPFTSTGAADAQTLLSDAFARLTDRGAALFAVTHLYELYEPLSARYGERLSSFVTESSADADGVHYAYRLDRRPPDVRRYARLIAESFGLSASRLLTDKGEIAQVEAFLQRGKEAAACL